MLEDRALHRWDLQAFDTDPERIRARLWEATTECPSTPLRMELLGDDEATARADHDRCRERVARYVLP